MATTRTFPRASTREILFWTIHVVELVVEVDGAEVSATLYGIHPTAAIAAEAASRIPTLTVED